MIRKDSCCSLKKSCLNSSAFTSTNSSVDLNLQQVVVILIESLSTMQAREFLMQKLYALKRPKTNIQILQQNVLLKYKYGLYSAISIFIPFIYSCSTCIAEVPISYSFGVVIYGFVNAALPFGCRYVSTFLQDHGREVYPEVRAAYVDTMSKVKRHSTWDNGAVLWLQFVMSF